jgi:hypothetical protein
MSFVVSPSSGSVGDPGTLLVKVAGQGLPAGVPTGTVSFYMSGTLLKTVTLDAGGNASHLVSNFPIGNVDIEAVYSGDSKFGQNRATASHFTRMPAGNSYPTRTTLTVSKTAATDSEPVRLTARVTRTAGDYNEPFAGPVLFKVGTRVVGRAQVNAEGVASVDVILPVGLDVVVAAYGGGNTYQESTSAGVTVNVTSSTSQPTETWTVAANVDANNDGILDAVIRKNETGDTAIRILDANGNVVRVETLPRTADPNWLLDTAVDVNNDQSVDLFWRNQNTGATLIWQLNSGKFVKVATLGAPRVAAGWRAVGGGDFNRDGFNDVVWFNDTTNKTSIWTMRGLNVRSLTMINSTPRADGWGLSAVRDVNDDGRPDLVWHNRITNTDFAWLMDNSTVVGSQKV